MRFIGALDLAVDLVVSYHRRSLYVSKSGTNFRGEKTDIHFFHEAGLVNGTNGISRAILN